MKRVQSVGLPRWVGAFFPETGCIYGENPDESLQKFTDDVRILLRSVVNWLSDILCFFAGSAMQLKGLEGSFQGT